MKKIFVIDWWLVFTFAITSLSGIELHIAGHGTSHETWHNWAVCHTIASIIFVILSIIHIKMHWGWYKTFKNGLSRKSRITIGLSIIYLATTITGLLLLSVSGANSKIGIWHFGAGLILTVLSVIHLIKRFNILQKSLKK